MPRVLVFCPELLPISQTFVLEQVASLRRWNVVLAGYRFTPGGLDLGRLQPRRVRGPLGLPVGRFTQSLLATPWGLAGLAHWARRLEPDLLHAHFATDAAAAWPWLQRVGVPMVVTLHGYDIQIRPDWWQSGAGGDAMRDYPARLARMAADPRVSFIAVSEDVRRGAIEAYGLPGDRIVVRHIGVDNVRFHPSGPPAGQRAPQVLYVGRMVEKKAAHVLLQAMAQVRQRMPGARVVLVGDGPLKARYETLARDLRLDAQFLGAQPASVVQAELARARVFCLPSVRAANGDAEGLPISVLEAQAMGVPVVTSACGARDEGIIDGATGFAFEEHDSDALAAHLLRLLGDDALASTMGRAAVQWVADRFALDACSAQLETVYDSARA